MSELNAREEARDLIASLHVCTLATCSAEGPHAVSLFYAHDDFDLFWLSDPASNHSRHIDCAIDSRVAVTIAADHQDFTRVCGVQMNGIARRIYDPSEISAGLVHLTRRYSFLSDLTKSPSGLADAMHKATVYHMSPKQVIFIDNKKGFGHKIVILPNAERF